MDLSPSYLRTLIDRVPMAILLADGSLRLRAANEGAQALCGRSASELKGLHLADLLHAEERMRLGGVMGRTAEAYQLTAIALRPSGHTWRADIRLRRFDMDGDEAWLVLINDVTAPHEALSALRGSEERYRRMVEASPDGIAVVEDGEVAFANGALEKHLGLGGADELWGAEFESFVHPDDQDAWQALLAGVYARGDAAPTELRLLHPGGEDVEVEAVCQSLGRPREKAVLLLLRDIKARKRMERRLRESEERYKGLADVAFDGLAVHFEGVILNANRSFEAIFGHKEGELLEV